MNFVIFIIIIALAKFVFNIGWELMKVALEQVGIIVNGDNKNKSE